MLHADNSLRFTSYAYDHIPHSALDIPHSKGSSPSPNILPPYRGRPRWRGVMEHRTRLPWALGSPVAATPTPWLLHTLNLNLKPITSSALSVRSVPSVIQYNYILRAPF